MEGTSWDGSLSCSGEYTGWEGVFFMFDRIADLHVDIYDGITNEFLGSTVFAYTPEVKRSFLGMINYHIVPESIIITNVTFYQATSKYRPPEIGEELHRNAVAHGKVRNADSKTWLDFEIYFTFDASTRGNYLGDQYYFDSVKYSNIKVQDIRLG